MRTSAGLVECRRAGAAALAGRVACAVVEDRDRAVVIGDVDGVARSVDGDRGWVRPYEDGRRGGVAPSWAAAVAAPGVNHGDARGPGHVDRLVRRVGGRRRADARGAGDPYLGHARPASAGVVG